ncbi:MAG: class I SAM-dependent methyltransferase [Alsobacter sp.]
MTACRFCRTPLRHSFVDLGLSPVSNAFVRPQDAHAPERFYPLATFVCEACLLVQLPAHEPRETHFHENYAYFSSFTESWLQHARRYVETMTQRLGLTRDSQVIEVASNDGYLLQYFVQAGIPALGIEPSANVARAAQEKGVPSLVRFFGMALAQELREQGVQADLLLGNNVLAHVPDINDFVGGLALALKPGGVLTLEFPHLLELITHNQFDTIYHEHYSYLSLLALRRIFAAHGLGVFDVERLETHGGSLRLHVAHAGEDRPVRDSVEACLADERRAGLDRLETYAAFAERVAETKRKLLTFLIEAKRAGKSVVGYGAPAKGNTLLNYCGIRTDFIDYTVDRNPHKQGCLLPGTRIPVVAPERIFETKPDYVLILPWNIAPEVCERMAGIAAWGGRFVAPIPEPRVL